jgi:hypothetical protein
LAAAELCRKSRALLAGLDPEGEAVSDDQTDADLKSLYAELAVGRITYEAAATAETAIHARRARREGNDTGKAKRPPVGLPRAAGRRAKIFGPGRGRPLDRNARARLMHQALTKRRQRLITRADLDVLRALLFDFHNVGDGRTFPSYLRLASAAHCAASTVAAAVKRLEQAHLLTWDNRLARIRERVAGLLGPGSGWRWRVIRVSNAYRFPSDSENRGGTTNQDFFPLFSTFATTETKGLSEGVRGTKWGQGKFWPPMTVRYSTGITTLLSL